MKDGSDAKIMRGVATEAGRDAGDAVSALTAMADKPWPQTVRIIANPKSGLNSREDDALAPVLEVFGDRAEVIPFKPGRAGGIEAAVDKALAQGADLVVSAGGDGTTVGVASAMLGRGVAMAALPMGTFNYFTRGLGLSEDPAEAARQILEGRPKPIRVAAVNGQPFLNNASLGLYPAILREREGVYKRFGRKRLLAHWSALKTFFRFRSPLTVTFRVDGRTETRKTAMIFVGRSAYQLESFGLEGSDVIRRDGFAVFVSRAGSRGALLWLAVKLAVRAMRRGEDYELIEAPELTIETRARRTLIAFDGEKRMEESPFHFSMSEDELHVVVPPHRDTPHDGLEPGVGSAS
ncbi:diacylglycerol/lipid kinase family protein [Acidimangrovimonas sediminis]|uniref:diacylglycerol/lipid kinase family protein n=1 Tax=Acidimangrovimonas sediminis TaxID=2056283 RepID=UPI001E2F11E8|nr:diacylglycerol kinase family protein [Acidimangrovimonas sediminis]